MSSREGPLTFGQLDVLRYVEQRIPPEVACEANLARPVEFAPGTTVAGVAAAVRGAVRRHESLRTIYSLNTDAPMQAVFEPDVAHEASCVVDASDADVWSRLTAEAAVEVFDLEAAPAWRVLLSARNGMATRGLFVLHHMVSDGLGLRAFAAEVAATAVGGAVPDPEFQQLALAVEQRSDTWAPRRAATSARWRRMSKEDLEVVYPIPCGGAGPRGLARLQLGAEGAAVEDLARRLGVLGQTIYLVLNAIAICSVLGRDRCLLSLMSANRLDPRCRSMISSLAQYAPLAVRLSGAESFVDLVRRAEAGALRAYSLSSYDLDEFAQFHAQAVGAAQQLDYVFNYMPEGRATDRAARESVDEARVEVRELPRRSGPHWSFVVSGAVDRPVLELVSAPAFFSTDLTRAVLEGMAQALRLVDQRPETRVSELLALMPSTAT